MIARLDLERSDDGPRGRVYHAPSAAELAALEPDAGRIARQGDSWTFGRAVVGIEENRRALVAGRVPASIFSAYVAARGALQPVVDEFSKIGRTTRRRRRYADEGDELNIDRLATGDPLFWERRKRGAKKRVVRLGVQYGYTAAAGESTFVRNAALATAAADALSLLGYGVEILAVSWGLMTQSHHGEEWTLAVDLKRSDEPLDAQRVLTTGLVAMSRAFEFALWDQECGGVNTWNMRVPPLSRAARRALGLDALIGQSLDVDDAGGAAFHDELDGFLRRASEAASGLPAAGMFEPEAGMDEAIDQALSGSGGDEDDAGAGGAAGGDAEGGDAMPSPPPDSHPHVDFVPGWAGIGPTG